jgi:hypothetical protein
MWDRFDDAMDDVCDEKTDLHGERELLTRVLENRGQTVEPWKPPPEKPIAPGEYMKDRFNNEVGELESLRAYVKSLRARVEST